MPAMKFKEGLIAVFCLIFAFQLSSSFAQNSSNRRVLWVPFKGTVELGLSPYIQRAIKYAEAEKYDALILEMDTFGGRVDAAVNIRDAFLDTPVLTATWINKRAISAGALVAYSTKKILFAPGSTMGAATPIQLSGDGEAKPVENKMVSYFRAEMGATAERFGRERRIAESMVRADEDIKGLVKKGDVLTLTDRTANTFKVADGVASNPQEVLAELHLEGAQVDSFSINWAEKIVRFLTDPTVSGFLMSIGILGILLELKAPGFGLPGILGIACFALFFGAKYIVHLAGLEEVFVLLVGLVLLFLEIFIFPGYFIFGLAGVLLILTSLFLAGISSKLPLDFSFPDIQAHVSGVAIALLTSMFGLILLYMWMMKNPKASPMVLGDEQIKSQGYNSQADNLGNLVGQEGLVRTALRPSGKAAFSAGLIDVVSEGEFIEAGAKVKVVEIDGPKIMVRRIV